MRHINLLEYDTLQNSELNLCETEKLVFLPAFVTVTSVYSIATPFSGSKNNFYIFLFHDELAAIEKEASKRLPLVWKGVILSRIGQVL